MVKKTARKSKMKPPTYSEVTKGRQLQRTPPLVNRTLIFLPTIYKTNLEKNYNKIVDLNKSLVDSSEYKLSNIRPIITIVYYRGVIEDDISNIKLVIVIVCLSVL